MHHSDYELAETCLQELRDGRSKRLTAEDVQKIASKMAKSTLTIERSGCAPVDNARDDAWLATCALAVEMEKQSTALDWAWNTAITSAREWFKAAE